MSREHSELEIEELIDGNIQLGIQVEKLKLKIGHLSSIIERMECRNIYGTCGKCQICQAKEEIKEEK